MYWLLWHEIFTLSKSQFIPSLYSCIKIEILTHMLFEFALEHAHALTSERVVLVIDREPGIAKAVKKVIPKLSYVYCRNHIQADVKDFLRG